MQTTPLARLRRLTAHDRAAVRDLFAHDGGYSLRVDGRPAQETDVDELLAAGPDGLDVAKESYGLFAGDALVAVIDVVRGWPTPHHAYLGLLQVDARRHGQGWGRIAHEHALDVVRRWPDIRTLRLAVVDSNREVLPFWRALGYEPTGEVKTWTSPSGVSHLVDILERPASSTSTG